MTRAGRTPPDSGPISFTARSRAAFWTAAGAAGALTRRHRRLLVLSAYSCLAGLSWTVAFLLRFELDAFDRGGIAWRPWWAGTLLGVVFVRSVVQGLAGLHRASWRYASLRDAVPLGASVVAGTALTAFALLLRGGDFPFSVLAIDLPLYAVLAGGFHYSLRLLNEIAGGFEARRSRRVLVVGAGAAASLTIRALRARGRSAWRPVAILDDDPQKHGTTLHGVPVVGPVAGVARAARRHAAAAVVLAVPTASSADLYRIVRQCRATGLPLKTIPDLWQLLSGGDSAGRITDFRPEDLLHRRPVRPDVPEIREFLRERCVLVTGAAGSIGSELCRQIVAQPVRRLVCLDRDENGLFRLEHELCARGAGDTCAFFLADIKDRPRLRALFADHRPDVVFHAAAYKHVPVLQHHPLEAVRNNVGGTRNLVELADEHQAGTFVLISTDKAVNPASVMGATKRVAEHLVRARSRRSATRFCAIRFGNVLGSNGSVVELFLRQIREGRPVTVTHPQMERYFMTIAEAVHLVLFAATMGRGGETFILDMGRPVNIDQLARQIIQLCGLTPEVDVPIVYTGLRPGEKLTEELWTAVEEPVPTAHPGIRMAPRNGFQVPQLEGRVARLLEAAEAQDLDAAWANLLALVPTFRGRVRAQAAVPPEAPALPPGLPGAAPRALAPLATGAEAGGGG